jgi:hypothetical protein
MRRLLLSLAVGISALFAAPVALADGGPVFVTQGGTGTMSHHGLHYVTVPDGAGGTLLEMVDVADGGVFGWARLTGSWGTPMIGYSIGEGLSRDGRTLVLGSTAGPYASPSKFLVVDARRLKAIRMIRLDGTFSFDALSPDGSKMYLIQYASSGDLSHYIVRAYDMRANRLLPGKIADRAEKEETMAGDPLTRTTSAGGRWVYTLYQKPSGEPFVHALDTVGAAAYCIDLPENRGLYNIVLSLRNGGRTLAVHWRSGRPWLNVATGSWSISYPRTGFPWAGVGSGIGTAVALLGLGALRVRRRRREEVEEHAREELGLAERHVVV